MKQSPSRKSWLRNSSLNFSANFETLHVNRSVVSVIGNLFGSDCQPRSRLHSIVMNDLWKEVELLAVINYSRMVGDRCRLSSGIIGFPPGETAAPVA